VLPCGSALADTTTFNFTGKCLDCSNPQGELVLENYTFGTPASASQFVSFNYTSSLADVSVTQSNLLSITANLASTPESDDFALFFTQNGQNFTFQTVNDGIWCYGLTNDCGVSLGGGTIGIDQGTDGIFSPADATATPEPSSLALLSIATAGSLAFARRRLYRSV
jgi:PEP-CTERM motif